jgi:hypothetical protein
MSNKLLLILARAVVHRVGFTDEDKPDVPVLTQRAAWTAFWIKISIILINFITCGFIVANVIHKW